MKAYTFSAFFFLLLLSAPSRVLSSPLSRLLEARTKVLQREKARCRTDIKSLWRTHRLWSTLPSLENILYIDIVTCFFLAFEASPKKKMGDDARENRLYVFFLCFAHDKTSYTRGPSFSSLLRSRNAFGWRVVQNVLAVKPTLMRVPSKRPTDTQTDRQGPLITLVAQKRR